MDSNATTPVNGDGSSTKGSSKPSHKLFHKFAPFRKRQLREVRSEESITPAEMLPTMNEIVDSANPSLDPSLVSV